LKLQFIEGAFVENLANTLHFLTNENLGEGWAQYMSQFNLGQAFDILCRLAAARVSRVVLDVKT